MFDERWNNGLFDKSKVIGLLITFLFLSACSSSGLPPQKKEELFLLNKDYPSLIKLKKEQLSIKNSDITRFDLAKYYYLSGDCESSRMYLSPLLNGSSYITDSLKLMAKNDICLKDFSFALSRLNKVLQSKPDDGEAHNIKGVALAYERKYKSAMESFASARMYMSDDAAAKNNMAALLIMEKKYKTAANLLGVMYRQGHKQQVVYNLLYALIKSGDIGLASEIITSEGLSSKPDDLIDSILQSQERPLNKA